MDDTPFAERMFELLDLNKDGTVDLQEFISGLSFLCKGTVEEKLARAYPALAVMRVGHAVFSSTEIE